MRPVVASFIAAIVLLACEDKQHEVPRTLPPWTPPPKTVLDTESTDVIVGRVWIVPNPIPIPPVPVGSGFTPLGFVGLYSLGTDETYIDRMTIEGSADFTTEFIERGFDWPYWNPEEYSRPEDGYGSGQSMWFEIWYTPTVEVPEETFLIVHTSDPTSPTFRVPIVVDHEGTYLPGGMDEDYWGMFEHAYVWTRPNPVRFSVKPTGRSEIVEVTLAGTGGADDPMLEVTDISVWGHGLSIAGIWDQEGNPLSPPIHSGSLVLAYLDIEHVSTGEEVCDGVLMLSFLDIFGIEKTLGVPILVR